ncbi:MAG: hypothetical protein LBE09_00590 [Christensenellaceae bacterium]|jgi:hypothetical protein|nr:hypothetical protein [Christensenellaceae bacterium]
MKKFITSHIVLICILLGCAMLFCIVTKGATEIARSSENDSHSILDEVEIKTASELFMLTDNPTNKIFRLVSDIDLTNDTSWHNSVPDWQSKGWEPLDTTNASNCIFDGGGHTIWNLSVNRDNVDAGLFSSNYIKVKNLFFEFAKINGDSKAGTLVAINYSSLDNVHAKGSINATDRAGGLIGINYGNIDNCSFEGNVEGNTVGGLIGENLSSMLSNSYSKGHVKGHYAGGLVGIAGGFTDEMPTIRYSLSSSEVEQVAYDTTPMRTAGFIAIKYDLVTVESCYSLYGTGTVSDGNSDGIITLLPEEFLSETNLSQLDFENYWAYINGEIMQRTLAVSANQLALNESLNIVGNKKYYLPGETVTLYFDNANKANIGLKSVVIDDTDLVFHFVNNEYRIGTIDTQINVEFDAWFMVNVVSNVVVDNKIVQPIKKYFNPQELIVFLIPRTDEYTIELKSTFLGVEASFVDITTDDDKLAGYYRYSVNLNQESYTDGAILYVDADYILPDSVSENDNISEADVSDIFVKFIICLVAFAIVSIVFSFTFSLTLKKSDEIYKDEGKRRRSKLSLRFKLMVLALLICIVSFSYMLVFELKIFEEWKNANITEVEYFDDAPTITYNSNGTDHTIVVDRNFQNDSNIQVGQTLNYLVKSPTQIMFNRSIYLIGFMIMEILLIAMLVLMTVFEVNKIRKNKSPISDTSNQDALA